VDALGALDAEPAAGGAAPLARVLAAQPRPEQQRRQGPAAARPLLQPLPGACERALRPAPEAGLRRGLAPGGSVIKYKSPLNALKDTYDHSCC
jgi:hypothetical protein